MDYDGRAQKQASVINTDWFSWGEGGHRTPSQSRAVADILRSRSIGLLDGLGSFSQGSGGDGRGFTALGRIQTAPAPAGASQLTGDSVAQGTGGFSLKRAYVLPHLAPPTGQPVDCMPNPRMKGLPLSLSGSLWCEKKQLTEGE